MDYVERLDKLIGQFAGETSGLLARVNNVSSEIDVIDDHISALKKTLVNYGKSVDDSSEKIKTAGIVYEELKSTIAEIAARINSIADAQKKQFEPYKSKVLTEEEKKLEIRIFHAVVDIATKMDAVSKTNADNYTTISKEYLSLCKKIEDKHSDQDRIKQMILSAEESVHDDLSDAVKLITEINKTQMVIADQVAILKAYMDNSNYERLSARLDDIVKEQEESKNNIMGRLAIISFALDAATQNLQDVSEKYDKLQMLNDQLNCRLNNLEKALVVTKENSEESAAKTQNMMEQLLGKLANIEEMLSVKKKGLFK